MTTAGRIALIVAVVALALILGIFSHPLFLLILVLALILFFV